MSTENSFYILPKSFYRRSSVINQKNNTDLPLKASLYTVDKSLEVDLNSLNLNDDEFIYAKNSVDVSDLHPKITSSRIKHKCKYEIITDTDLSTNVTMVKVSDLLELINDNLIKLDSFEINQLNFFIDNFILSEGDYIHAADFEYNYYLDGVYKYSNKPSLKKKHLRGYFSLNTDRHIIHKLNLISNSTRKILNENDYKKLISLIESNTLDNFEIAMNIISISNINKSFHIAALITKRASDIQQNRLITYFRKHKQLKQYGLDIRLGIDMIVNKFKKFNNNNIEQEELNFLCDNYKSIRTEHSQIFKFKPVLL
jgi:hypothetical protein